MLSFTVAVEFVFSLQVIGLRPLYGLVERSRDPTGSGLALEGPSLTTDGALISQMTLETVCSCSLTAHLMMLGALMQL